MLMRRYEPKSLGTKRLILKAIINTTLVEKAEDMERNLLKVEQLMQKYEVIAGRPRDEDSWVTVIIALSVKDVKDRLHCHSNPKHSVVCKVARTCEVSNAEIGKGRSARAAGVCQQGRAKIALGRLGRPDCQAGRPGAISQQNLAPRRSQVKRDRISSWLCVGQASASTKSGEKGSQERMEGFRKSAKEEGPHKLVDVSVVQCSPPLKAGGT